MTNKNLKIIILLIFSFIAGYYCVKPISRQLAGSSTCLGRKQLLSPEKSAYQFYKRIKRSAGSDPRTLFQNEINDARLQCAKEKGLEQHQVKESYMDLRSLSKTDKCMVACMLKRIKLMNNANRIDVEACKRMANALSQGDLEFVTLVGAVAQFCDGTIRSKEECEAAAEIHRCVKPNFKQAKIKF